MFGPKIENHTFFLDKVGTRWDVYYQGPDHDEPQIMFDQLTGPSSAVQLLCGALRILEEDSEHNTLEVVDPTGLWETWVAKKLNIPTHTIFH